MSATKWKTKGFVRPWSPRNWPIAHVGECIASDDPFVVDRTGEMEGRAFVFVGVPPGFAGQSLTSVYDRFLSPDSSRPAAPVPDGRTPAFE